MNKVKILIGSVLGAIVLLGCSKEVEDKGPEPTPNPYTKVIFEFTQNVDGASLEADTAKYENASGNIYGVSNVQFLVGTFRLDAWDSQDPVYINEYHLFDLNDPSTWTFSPKDSIKIDDYQNITLFMGLDEASNITGNYPDLDDRGWGWAPKYGGGYYTLKMYGDYFSSAAITVTKPYNMGLGGNMRIETPNDTTYSWRGIYASMTEGFSIPAGTHTVKIEVRMDVNKLFKNNFEIANYNLDVHQSNIEEDAVGSATLSDNIAYCFRLGSVTLDDAATGQ